MQLLDALDYWMADDTSKHSAVSKFAEANEQNLILWDQDGLSMFPSAFPPTGTKNKSQQLQSLKALESVAVQTKDLLGWPFLSPYKFTLVKCEKCSLEFCSAINHRRHCRVHRKSLNNNKDSLEKRKLLGAYLDKLSLEEAREILSLKEASIENVSGSSIIKALASSVKKPGFLLMSPAYVKAGSTLVDFVGGDASAFPISSKELFSVLDDASEGTFLSCGNASSLQLYLFGGNAGNIALELKNLASCVSFLIEQELIKAWVVHKEAESLRCEQLLVEEEEAAHKRQADLLERKRLKKLRQKDKRVKEPAKYTNTDVTIKTDAASAEAFEASIHSDHCPYNQEASSSPELNLVEDSILVDHEELIVAAPCRTEDVMAVPSQTKNVNHKVDTHELGMEQQHSVSGQFPGAADDFSDNNVTDKTLAADALVNLLGGISIGSRDMEMKSEEGTDKREKSQGAKHDKCIKRELLIGSILIILDDNDDALIKDALFIGKESLREIQVDAKCGGKIDDKMGVHTVCHDNHLSATVCESTEIKVSEDDSDDTESAKLITVKENFHAEKDVVYDEHNKNSPVVPSAASTASKFSSSQAAKDFLSQRWKNSLETEHETFFHLSNETEEDGIK